MDRRTEMSFAAFFFAAIVLFLWGYLQGHSVHGHVAVGLFVLCPYAAITTSRHGTKVGGKNVLLALGTTVAIGLVTSRFSALLLGTRVSTDSALAATLGALLIVYWGLARLHKTTHLWSLAVGLTYALSGAIFIFLDLALN